MINTEYLYDMTVISDTDQGNTCLSMHTLSIKTKILIYMS